MLLCITHTSTYLCPRYFTIISWSCIRHWLFSLWKCCIGWWLPFKWGREALQTENMGKSVPRVLWGTNNFIPTFYHDWQMYWTYSCSCVFPCKAVTCLANELNSYSAQINNHFSFILVSNGTTFFNNHFWFIIVGNEAKTRSDVRDETTQEIVSSIARIISECWISNVDRYTFLNIAKMHVWWLFYFLWTYFLGVNY